MRTPDEWYEIFHPEGLGIEERENFLAMVTQIQEDALAGDTSSWDRENLREELMRHPEYHEMGS